MKHFILISWLLVSLVIVVLGQIVDQSFLKKLENLTIKVNLSVSKQCQDKIDCTKAILNKFSKWDEVIFDEMFEALDSYPVNELKANELALQINKPLCCGYWAAVSCMIQKSKVWF